MHLPIAFYCSYLVTTFKTVPRGTEGAISIEGTVAGLCASIFLASVGFLMAEVKFMLSISFSQSILHNG